MKVNDLKIAEQLIVDHLVLIGTGLHWPDLDEDLSVTGIIEGKFGY